MSHRCPKQECTTIVSDRLFACAPHWFALPLDIQNEIYRTARLPLLHLERRAVVAEARLAWGDLSGGAR